MTAEIERALEKLIAEHGIDRINEALTPLIGQFNWDAWQRVYNLPNRISRRKGKLTPAPSGVKLTPEDFQKLETKELANIIRKLGAGKTLTKREEEKLERAKTKDDPDAGAQINFAQTWDELARVLTQRLGVSVTRRSLQTWRVREDLISKWPRDRADGRKDVQAWMRFILEHGLNHADELLEPDEIDGDEPRSLRDWKEHREKLMCAKLEREIARGDNLLLVAAELEIPIGATLAAVQTKLSQFPPRISRFMVGLRDQAEAEDKLQYEIDAVLADLQAANYLDQSLSEILASLPFDAETEKLFELVTFDGQDRQQLLQLIECVARETLRRIGQRVIAATNEAAASPTPEADESLSSTREQKPDGEKSAAPVVKAAVTKPPRGKRRSSTTPRKA
jgi:hypothetical protein